jgi:hypothetical protein
MFSDNASTDFNWEMFCICDWCFILGHLAQQIQNSNEMLNKTISVLQENLRLHQNIKRIPYSIILFPVLVAILMCDLE